MSDLHVAWLAYAAPLAGCVLIALLGFARRARRRAAPRSLDRLRRDAGRVRAQRDRVRRGCTACTRTSRSIHSVAWTWLQSGELHVDNSILVDQLSAVMLLVVTGVGFLIHVYSVGYMHGDLEERALLRVPEPVRVLDADPGAGGELRVLLVGWGMVGLSSYLLIGFWHQKPSAVAAAKKAFVMNAVGDVGMAIGIFMIFRELGTVDYIEVFARPGAARRRHVDDQLDLRAAADRRRSRSRRSCRCTPGCPTRWRARPRSPR